MIIYKTTNLINGKIYIGQTNGKASWYIGGGKYLKRAIKKYGKENFKFEVIVEGDFNQALLDELEIHYIQLYNSTNKIIGYNLRPGGSGNRNYKLSQEHKDKISKAHLGIKKNPWSPERRLQMLKIHIGKKVSEETKQKISKANSRAVIQMDLQGNFIKEWSCITEVERKLGISNSNISACCNNRRGRKSLGGFKWKHKE